MSVAERVADIAASLSWPWSSMHEGHKMSEEDARLAVANYATFKPVVRMRLLMALWHLPARDKAAIAADLERLSQMARADDDQWVRVVAAAVGEFRGPLDLPSLVALPAVRDTVDGIARVLADNEAAGGPLIVPEAAYLSPYAMQCLGLPEPHPESRSPHLKARPSHVPPFQPLPPRTQGVGLDMAGGVLGRAGPASGERANGAVAGGLHEAASGAGGVGMESDGLEWEEASLGDAGPGLLMGSRGMGDGGSLGVPSRPGTAMGVDVASQGSAGAAASMPAKRPRR